MMKFQLRIEGENFLVAIDSFLPRKHGFFVIAHVEARNEEEAEKIAFDLIRSHDELRQQSKNATDDLPRLRTDECRVVAEWPEDTARPLTGFGWYLEELN